MQRYGRVPTYHKQRSFSPNLTRGIVGGYANAGATGGLQAVAGKALGDFGAMFLEEADKDRKDAQAAYFAKAKMNVDGALGKAAIQYETDPQGYAEHVRTIRSKWLAEVPDGIREDVSLYFDQEAQGHGLKIQKKQQDHRRAENDAVILEAMNTAQDRAAQYIRSGDLEKAGQETVAFEAFRRQRLENGRLSPEEFVKMGEEHTFAMTRNRALGEYERAMGQDMNAANAFIQGLRENENIPVEDRDKIAGELEKMFDHDVAEHVRLAEKREKTEEKALKARQDINNANLVAGLSTGQTTRKVVQDTMDRREIDGDHAASLFKALNSDGAETSQRSAISELYQDLNSDMPSRAKKDKALKMFGDGLISKSDLDSYWADVDGSGNESEEIKQYRRYVSNAIVTAGPLAVLDQDTSYRKASAEREFNERVRAGENPKDVADDVVARFRLASPGPTGLPSPRFLNGDRSDPSALEAARQATVKALQDGTLTRAQAAEEARLIKQLMEFANTAEAERKTAQGARR